MKVKIILSSLCLMGLCQGSDIADAAVEMNDEETGHPMMTPSNSYENLHDVPLEDEATLTPHRVK